MTEGEPVGPQIARHNAAVAARAVPAFELESSLRFFARHLLEASASAPRRLP